MYVYVCIMYVCMCICMCVYVCMYIYVCMCVYMYVCVYVCMYVRTYVCICVYVCMCVCMYVCMYYVCICVYVCMYVCVTLLYFRMLHYNWVILHANFTHYFCPAQRESRGSTAPCRPFKVVYDFPEFHSAVAHNSFPVNYIWIYYNSQWI